MKKTAERPSKGIHSAVPILLSILLRKTRSNCLLHIRAPGILVLLGEGLGRLDDKKNEGLKIQRTELRVSFFLPLSFVFCGAHGLRMRGSHAFAGAATEGDGAHPNISHS